MRRLLRLEEAMTAGGSCGQEWRHCSDTERYEAGEAFQPPKDETGGNSHV